VGDDLEGPAREALRLVQVAPREAAELAGRSRAAARAARDPAAQSVAERALGLAALHLQDLEVAARHLRSAIRQARRAGSAELVAEARMTWAFALNRQGQARRALAEIDAALDDLGALERARAQAQRAAIQQQLGHLDEALAGYRAALPFLRRSQDVQWVQRVLLNRGVLHAFRHNHSAALKDLYAAQQLCAQHGLELPAAFVEENLGFVYGRLGDVPRALHHLDAAEHRYRAMGTPVGSLLVERSELLLSVLLVTEARAAATEAVAEFTRAHRHLNTPEARLLLARTAMLDGDPQVALREAHRAVTEFGRQQRHEWTALARVAELTARAGTDAASRVRVGDLEQAADDADAHGWAGAALDARLVAAGLALDRHRRADGLRVLDQVSRYRGRGPAIQRARAWYATALARDTAGDRRGASVAVTRGLRILDEYRATMAATDLRARVSGLRTDLVRLGLRAALADGTPARVLDWAELGRSRYLLERPAVPPVDPVLAGQLAELRAVVAEVRERRLTGQDLRPLTRRQVLLEEAIRDHSRRRPGESTSDPSRRLSVGVLGAQLADAALVEFIELDGQLHAVTVVRGRARLHHLGPVARLVDLVHRLPFALRRLARQQTSAESQDAAVQLLRAVARQLDQILILPLVPQLADRRPVVVPTGLLQSLPWALLPSLAGRPMTVAPSAALWQLADRRPARPGRSVVVAGPGLPGALDEARRVAVLHGCTALAGEAATVEAVTSALDGAGLAHLAAHGQIRADNPLFSSLQLADGPLTVYDLERLSLGPDTVVLAACESGRSVVLAGDELLGLAAAFLCRDTRQLIASVVPVPDAETAPLMVVLHTLLARGSTPAEALAQAQQQVGQGEPAALAAAAGFVSLGAGFTPLPGGNSGLGVENVERVLEVGRKG
jgi:CHAT domain-containing protein/tetratricopeptide (TPR) repeat protein